MSLPFIVEICGLEIEFYVSVPKIMRICKSFLGETDLLDTITGKFSKVINIVEAVKIENVITMFIYFKFVTVLAEYFKKLGVCGVICRYIVFIGFVCLSTQKIPITFCVITFNPEIKSADILKPYIAFVVAACIIRYEIHLCTVAHLYYILHILDRQRLVCIAAGCQCNKRETGEQYSQKCR